MTNEQITQIDAPDGWVSATAEELCDKIQDGTHFSPKVQLDEGVFPYITAKNVRPWGLDLARLTYLREEDHREIYRRCDARKGDVLLVKDGVNTGDACVNTLDGEISLLSSVCMLRPREALLSAGFLRYYLQSPMGSMSLTGRMTGTAIRRIILRRINRTPVVLCSLTEQHRIVDAIESYFTRLDDAVATLERVQRNLKRYRASVLKAAVEGRLVPTEAALARAEGRDYESASVLLERILAERRRRWEEAELAKTEAKGHTPKNDKWKAKYKKPAELDTSGMPPLPEGWCWVNLSLIKEFSLYGPRFSSDDYADKGQLVLRTSDISESGKVNLDTAPRIALDDDDFHKYRADLGDLLITRTGSLGTLAVFNDQVDAIPGAYLIQFRLAAPEEVPWFCFYVFKSPKGQAHLTQGGAGVGRPNLNAPTIESLVFGMPPLAEQSRILSEVHRLLSITDGLDAEASKGERRCYRLRQAILKWAFEGKLVDQDPEDEPAAALLERIKAEREAAAIKKPKTRERRESRSSKA